MGYGDVRFFEVQPTRVRTIGFTMYKGVYYLGTRTELLTCKYTTVPGLWHSLTLSEIQILNVFILWLLLLNKIWLLSLKCSVVKINGLVMKTHWLWCVGDKLTWHENPWYIHMCIIFLLIKLPRHNRFCCWIYVKLLSVKKKIKSYFCVKRNNFFVKIIFVLIIWDTSLWNSSIYFWG